MDLAGLVVVGMEPWQTFGLVVRGWDNHVAYGYPGGTEVRRTGSS